MYLSGSQPNLFPQSFIMMIARIITVCLLALHQVDSLNILFIGNSYTKYSDIPGMTKGIAEAAGHSVKVKQLIKLGTSFEERWTKEFRDIIRQGGSNHCL